MKIENITVNYLKQPIGLDEIPEFSWNISSNVNGTYQTSYRVEVYGVWDSGVVNSDNCLFIKYDGKELSPRTRYDFKITVTDNFGNTATAESYFETGLLTYKNFNARWILNFCGDGKRLPVFRKQFKLTQKVKTARIYATALGVYQIDLNGKKVGDGYFAPGYTPAHLDTLYQTYDVTDCLQAENCVCVTVASGWVNGANMTYREDGQNVYDIYRTFALLQLDGVYEDGEEFSVYTDNTWKWFPSPWSLADMYNGETYDAREELPSAYLYGYDESKLNRVLYHSYPYAQIHGAANEQVKKDVELKPVKIFVTEKGERVIDFGQNISGFVKFKVSGKKGDKVIYNHAEVLDKNGNVYVENMRSAKNIIEYTLKGDVVEEFEPHFTFQGFRYVNIIEYPGELKEENFKAYSVRTDYKKTGFFECSNDLVNKLFLNAEWGQADNFVDVPTDCPQRDERMGWTGDAQIFIKTAALNGNVGAFFRKWLKDLALEQAGNGLVFNVVPRVKGEGTSSGWGDAATICPSEIYKAYGDVTILKNQFESMEKWVKFIGTQSTGYLWNSGFHFGDWLGLDASEGSYEGKTDKYLIATAYYAYSTLLTAEAAKVLGYDGKAEKYFNLHNNIVNAYKKEFLDEQSRIKSNKLTQTACAVTLYFDLTDDKKAVCDDLVSLINLNGGKLATGFIGTPYITYSLSRNGRVEEAYDLLLQTEYPSWLYPVLQGATTIWEHWDGIKPNGDFWSADMNSFNHYAYGAIASWLYTDVIGINYKTAGYKTFTVKPLVSKKLKYANGYYECMYGKISSSWRIDGDKVNFKLTVPCNTTCDFIYGDFTKRLSSGSYEFSLDFINA